MSLTSFLKQPDITKLFEDRFGVYSPELQSDIYTPPLTKNYALVGTAFDYLLRFHLAKLNNAENSHWVANHSLKLTTGYQKEKVRVALQNARYIYEQGNATDWPEHCIRLAKLDGIYRSSRYDFSPICSKDIDDLNNLLQIVPFNEFQGSCILNPTFNEGSLLVGGADADFVIGNTLVDIKTTKYLKFTKEMYYQLIGYKLLADDYGITGHSIKIEKLAIYFSRYALLHVFEVETEGFSNVFTDF